MPRQERERLVDLMLQELGSRRVFHPPPNGLLELLPVFGDDLNAERPHPPAWIRSKSARRTEAGMPSPRAYCSSALAIAAFSAANSSGLISASRSSSSTRCAATFGF